MPGSPLANLAGEEVGTLTAAERDQVMRQAGLDRPLQIASMSATASDIVNLAAITAYDINS